MLCLQSGFALPSLWVRSGFALAPLLKVGTKSVQNGMKKNSTSSIRLSNDSFFSEQYQFRLFCLFCAVFGSARMLLRAACERRGVHFSATLSEPSTGRFLHLHSGFALPSLWVRSAFAPMSGGKEYSKRYEIDFTITIYRIENWLARRVAKGEFDVQYDDNECD